MWLQLITLCPFQRNLYFFFCYILQVYDIIWHLYILRIDHHHKSSYHLFQLLNRWFPLSGVLSKSDLNSCWHFRVGGYCVIAGCADYCLVVKSSVTTSLLELEVRWRELDYPSSKNCSLLSQSLPGLWLIRLVLSCFPEIGQVLSSENEQVGF